MSQKRGDVRSDVSSPSEIMWSGLPVEDDERRPAGASLAAAAVELQDWQPLHSKPAAFQAGGCSGASDGAAWRLAWRAAVAAVMAVVAAAWARSGGGAARRGGGYGDFDSAGAAWRRSWRAIGAGDAVEGGRRGRAGSGGEDEAWDEDLPRVVQYLPKEEATSTRAG